MKLPENDRATQRDTAALLVPCASRKKVRPPAEACAVSLPRSDQKDLKTAWLSRLRGLPLACRADALYAGRGFRLARQAASDANAPLFIVSAGLGLVAGDREIPTYGLTVGGRGPESVSGRLTGQFDPVDWWDAINQGPFATPLRDVFSRAVSGPVLVGLTQPYARMLAPALDALPEESICRLRIVGVHLKSILPARLVSSVLPYDERLDAVFPGTRADFPQRALLHFVREGLRMHPDADAADHSNWVRAALAHRHAPRRPQRRRLSDEAIISMIERRLSTTPSIGRLLRLVRDEEGIACEQARFSRLYRVAIERRAAA